MINHKRVQRILSELGLHARRKSQRKATTKIAQAYPRYRRFDLFLVDELGYLPFAKQTAELLFQFFRL